MSFCCCVQNQISDIDESRKMTKIKKKKKQPQSKNPLELPEEPDENVKNDFYKALNDEDSDNEDTVLMFLKKYDNRETRIELNNKKFDGKSPVFVAASKNKKNIMQILLANEFPLIDVDVERDEQLFDETGQSLFYHIIENLSPDMCNNGLNQLQIIDHKERTDKYYLYALEPSNDNCIESALTSLVDKERYELMDHPVIDKLVTLKWKSWPRRICWIEMVINVICCLSWMIFATLKPYEQWYNYDMSTDIDRLRLACLVFGLLLPLTWPLDEFLEIYAEKRFRDLKENESTNQQTQESTEESINKTKPLWNGNFCLCLNRRLTGFYYNHKTPIDALINYMLDPWNWYDWLTIILVYIEAIYHFSDISSHTKEKAKTHLQLICVTIPILCIRLLKQLQCMFKPIGLLIIGLSLSIKPLLAWFCLYILFWIPFSVTSWVMYGNVKYSEDVSNLSFCEDPENETLTDLYNCTVVESEDFSTFQRTLYSILILTMGKDIDDENRRAMINEKFTLLLTGVFAVIFTTILLNVFIAVVSDSFNEANSKKLAYFNMNRAKRIVYYEKLSNYMSKSLRKIAKTIGSPYIDDNYSDPRFTPEPIGSDTSNIYRIEQQLNEIKDSMKSRPLIQNITNHNINNNNKNTHINQQNENIAKKMEELLIKFELIEAKFRHLEIKCICNCSCQTKIPENSNEVIEVADTNTDEIENNIEVDQMSIEPESTDATNQPSVITTENTIQNRKYLSRPKKKRGDLESTEQPPKLFGYNGPYGYRRNTPALRNQPNLFEKSKTFWQENKFENF